MPCSGPTAAGLHGGSDGAQPLGQRPRRAEHDHLVTRDADLGDVEDVSPDARHVTHRHDPQGDGWRVGPGQNHCSSRSGASQNPSPSFTWPCQISGMKPTPGASASSWRGQHRPVDLAVADLHALAVDADASRRGAGVAVRRQQLDTPRRRTGRGRSAASLVCDTSRAEAVARAARQNSTVSSGSHEEVAGRAGRPCTRGTAAASGSESRTPAVVEARSAPSATRAYIVGRARRAARAGRW